MDVRWTPIAKGHHNAPSYYPQTSPLRAPFVTLSDAERSSGPVGFLPDSLPLPCAYLKLPWPRGKSFSRLLPARTNTAFSVSSWVFRQYIKRMIVEEICASPPYYLIRYTHFARSRLTDTASNSRVVPFLLCRKAFPPVQALSIQQALVVQTPCLQLTIKEYLHPNGMEQLIVVHGCLGSWNSLPLQYRELQDLWMRDVVPHVLSCFGESGPQRKPVHLIATYDLATGNETWTPNNMRQVVHLVAQTVSVACATLPLCLIEHPEASSTSHKAGTFESFQVVLFPPKQFNQGVSSLRDRAEESPTTAVLDTNHIAGRIVPGSTENSSYIGDDKSIRSGASPLLQRYTEPAQPQLPRNGFCGLGPSKPETFVYVAPKAPRFY